MLKLPSIFSTLQKTTLQLMFLTISASRSLLRMKKGSLRSYEGFYNENVTLKASLCDYSKLITLYKLGEVYFPLLRTNGFYIEGKNERFSACGSHCRQNFKYEIFTSSFGRLRQQIAPQSVPHVQHDYFSSFNRSIH